MFGIILGNIEVVEFEKKDFSQSCNVLGRAFLDQPNVLAMLDGDVIKAEKLLGTGIFELIKLNRRYNKVWTAYSNGIMVGVVNVAKWPHCQMSAFEKLRTAPRMMRMLGSSATKALKMMSAWEKQDPKKPHLHIGPIGVIPEIQGKGVGTKLMEACLVEADSENLPAYLETDRERNVPFYEKLGFNVIGEEAILGVQNRYMWRESKDLLK